MVDKGTYDWSTSAGSNGNADPTINFLEGQLAPTLNNSARALMARFAQWLDEYGGTVTVAGTADAITVASSTVYTAIGTGIRLMFIPGADNTGAATLKLDGLSAKKLRRISAGADIALAAGDIKDGLPCEVLYDEAADSAAGAWIVLNPQATTTTPALPPGYLYGLTLSNNGSDATNDIDIAAGSCRDIADAANIVLASALTKRLDAAWAVGTNQGGLDTGSIANTTYHVYAIARSDTGVVDVLFSTSASSPTMPTNYDRKRRIGSILRESGAIVGFVQDGDTFMRGTPVSDANVSSPTSTAVSLALSLPAGVKVLAILGARLLFNGTSNSGFSVLFSDLAQPDVTPTTDAFTFDLTASQFASSTNSSSGGMTTVRTNTSRQIRYRPTAGLSNLRISTYGWIDTRGRLA